MAIVLETERLSLRELVFDDAPFIVELLNEPSFIQYIGDRGVRTLDDARAYFQAGPMASYEAHCFGLWLATLKESDERVGICGLLKRDTLAHVDVGFAFLPAYWRRGYAVEAAGAALAHGLKTLGLGRVVAITSPDNEGSKRVLERIGMTFERMISLGGKDDREVRLFASGPLR